MAWDAGLNLCHEERVVKQDAIDLGRLDDTEGRERDCLAICLILLIGLSAKVWTRSDSIARLSRHLRRADGTESDAVLELRGS